MSFDTVLDIYDKYYEKRELQFKKNEKITWFTNDYDSYEKLFEKFATERKALWGEWDAVKNKKPVKIRIYQKIRLKLGWICGTLRDTRTQFVCYNDNHTPAPQDGLRFNCLRIRFIRIMLNKIKELMK